MFGRGFSYFPFKTHILFRICYLILFNYFLFILFFSPNVISGPQLFVLYFGENFYGLELFPGEQIPDDPGRLLERLPNPNDLGRGHDDVHAQVVGLEKIRG